MPEIIARSLYRDCRINCPPRFLPSLSSEDDKPTVLGEAEAKMAWIKRDYWFLVAKELQGEDPYRFLRAYTPGT